jgi:hypothetical protein
MAFPQEPERLCSELYIDGAWVDITDDVRGSAGITIERGRADEQGRVGTSRCNLTINNANGLYSNRNPNSVYYKKLGRNTPFRQSVLMETSYLRLTDYDDPDYAFDRATTPDHASLDIVGDIDIRVDAEMDITPTGSSPILVSKGNAGSQFSWSFNVLNDNTLAFSWSASGTAFESGEGSTMPAPRLNGKRMAFRVTLDVNNGAGGHTVTFYTAETIAGPWTQLGDAVVGTGVTSVFNSSTPVEVGNSSTITGEGYRVKVYAFELLNGIAGSAVADPDFTIQTVGATSFIDAAGRTWTLQGSAELDNRDVRFVGEVPQWTSRWDKTGNDVWTPIEADGITRRIIQNKTPKSSALRRLLRQDLGGSGYVYIPLEDGTDAQRFVNGLDDRSFVTKIGLALPGTVDTLVGSDKVAQFKPGSSFGPTFVNGFNDSIVFASFLFKGFMANEPRSVNWTIAQMAFSGGNVLTREIQAYAEYSAGDFVSYGLGFNGATFATGQNVFDGLPHVCSVYLLQNGANIDYYIYIDGVETTGSSAGTIGSLTSVTGPSSHYVRVFGTGDSDNTDSSIGVGHLYVADDFDAMDDTEYYDAALGHPGEPTWFRAQRICDEEGWSFRSIGESYTAYTTMGPQRIESPLNLLYDVEDTEQGILYEPRDFLGFALRTRNSMTLQADGYYALNLDYSLSHLAETPDPTDDDAYIANDITGKRIGGDGSTYREYKDFGPLSILPAPEGVGVYDDELEINVETDADIEGAVGWRLAVGTWDEARFPNIVVGLNRPPFTTDAALSADVARLDIGDYLSIANPPDFLPPDLIELHMQGVTERLTNDASSRDWNFNWNTTPVGPFGSVVALDSSASRLDTVDSSLLEAVNTTATTLAVGTLEGPLWTTTAGHFPFDIGLNGERMRVTNITNTAITFVATGTVSHANNASVTPGLPAGRAAGDLLLILVAIRNTSATISEPVGWETLVDMDNVKLMSRIATATAADQPTITFAGGSAGDDTSAQMTCFRGKFLNVGGSGTYFNEVLQTTTSNASAQNITLLPLPVERPDCLIIALGWKQDDWTSVAALSGYTEIGEPDTTTGNDQGIVWDYKIRTTVGHENGTSFVVTGGAGAISKSAVIAIRGGQQTFTVTRSINGVVKSHSAGDRYLHLWKPIVLGR